MLGNPVPDPIDEFLAGLNRRGGNQRVAPAIETRSSSGSQQTPGSASKDPRRKKTITITHAEITVAVQPDATQREIPGPLQTVDQGIEPVRVGIPSERSSSMHEDLEIQDDITPPLEADPARMNLKYEPPRGHPHSPFLAYSPINPEPTYEKGMILECNEHPKITGFKNSLIQL